MRAVSHMKNERQYCRNTSQECLLLQSQKNNDAQCYLHGHFPHLTVYNFRIYLYNHGRQRKEACMQAAVPAEKKKSSMEEYTTPAMELIRFGKNDVITSSREPTELPWIPVTPTAPEPGQGF